MGSGSFRNHYRAGAAAKPRRCLPRNVWGPPRKGSGHSPENARCPARGSSNGCGDCRTAGTVARQRTNSSGTPPAEIDRRYPRYDAAGEPSRAGSTVDDGDSRRFAG